MTLQPDWSVAGLHLAIIVTVIYAAKSVYEFRDRFDLRVGGIGRVAILCALAAVGLFYVLDIVTQHLFPLFDIAPEFLSFALTEWPEIHERVAVLTVGLIVLGIAAATRGFRTLLSTVEDRERKFRAFFDNVPMSMSLKDHDGRFLLINKSHEEWLGLSARDVVGKTMNEIVDDPALLEGLSESEKIVRETNAVHEAAMRVKRPNGQIHDQIVTKFPVRSPNGSIASIGTFTLDITERLRAEKKAAESGILLRSLIDASPSRITLKDRDGKFMLVNKAFAENLGATVDDVVGKSMYDYADGIYADMSSAQDHHAMESGKFIEEEYEATLNGGTQVHRHLIKFPVRGATGAIVGVGSISANITDRKRAEESLRDRERQLKTITNSVPVLIAYMDAGRRFQFVNKTTEDWYGRPAEEIIGNTVESLLGEQAYGKMRPFLNKVFTGESITFEDTVKYPDGTNRNVQISYVPDIEEEGTVRGYFGLSVDLTARREAEAARRESEIRLQDAIESMSEGFALYDRDERLVLCNQHYRDTFPVLSTIEGLLVPGVKFEDFVRAGAERGFVVAAKGRVEEYVRERVEKFRNPPGPFEYRQTRGNWIRSEERKTAEGATVCIRSDITKFRLAEEQLHQSQKMEIVGQLTGGLAHDFNNLLGVIIGNLDFLAEELRDNANLLSYTEGATRAALSGAKLNRQLLAFSRKQTLSPEVIDLNAQVSGMFDLLRRTLGEAVEIEAKQSHGPWTTNVDPTQLESALLNLAVNARDAMPVGGTLTIETMKVRLDAQYAETHAEVTQGDYVKLAVSDTGTGMAPEVLAQVFEPFFTTKDVGEGSGLGLSMVFGFAKQSGGHVEIESEEGAGTTVKLYLPFSRRLTRIAREETADIPKARGETVLVVEDDPDLLILAGALLGGLGYAVLEAKDGRSALAALNGMTGVDLLLTDVVMPGGMSGPALAKEAVARQSNIKVLYMSGYTKDAMPDHNQQEDEAALLRKPFRKSELARMVRSALDT